MTDPRTAIGEPRRIAALWIGLLLAPAAFLANLELGYALVSTACRTGRMLPLYVVNVACLMLAVLGVLVARRTRQAAPGAGPDEESRAERTRFMGQLGVAVGLLFALVIVSQAIPGFVLSPCQ